MDPARARSDMVGSVSSEVGSVDGGQALTTAVIIKAVVIMMDRNRFWKRNRNI